MAKKRTKKQKTRATYHYAYPAGRSFVGLTTSGADDIKTTVVHESNVSQIYQYDPKYLRIDLTKTFVITLVMVALEIGLYYWLY